MNDRISELQKVINEEGAKVSQAKAELARLRSSCRHEWGPVIDCSEYIPSHYVEGDPPGTMGVDWRPGFYTEAKIIRKWKRTCNKCGLTQETSRCDEHTQISRTPRF